MHASPLDPPDRSSSLCGGLEIPTPNRLLSDTVPAPLVDLGQSLTESACETTPHGALEARNVKRKASRVLGRATLDTDIVDTSKAFAELLAQAQAVCQDRLGLIQTQLTEELESWKVEQQAREDPPPGSKGEQTSVPPPTQRGPTVPKTLRTNDWAGLCARAQGYVPSPKPVSRHHQPLSSFADLAALLAPQAWRARMARSGTQKTAESNRLKQASSPRCAYAREKRPERRQTNCFPMQIGPNGHPHGQRGNHPRSQPWPFPRRIPDFVRAIDAYPIDCVLILDCEDPLSDPRRLP